MAFRQTPGDRGHPLLVGHRLRGGDGLVGPVRQNFAGAADPYRRGIYRVLPLPSLNQTCTLSLVEVKGAAVAARREASSRCPAFGPDRSTMLAFAGLRWSLPWSSASGADAPDKELECPHTSAASTLAEPLPTA